MIAFLVAELYFDGLYRIFHFIVTTIAKITVLEGQKSPPKWNTDSKTIHSESMVPIDLSDPKPVIEDTMRPLENGQPAGVPSSVIKKSEHPVQ